MRNIDQEFGACISANDCSVSNLEQQIIVNNTDHRAQKENEKLICLYGPCTEQGQRPQLI